MKTRKMLRLVALVEAVLVAGSASAPQGTYGGTFCYDGYPCQTY